jgi:hypothetical protein
MQMTARNIKFPLSFKTQKRFIVVCQAEVACAQLRT